MSYDEDNELWYLIGARMKVPATVNAITSKKKTPPASKHKNTKNTKVVKENKEESFSGYLKDYKAPTTEEHVKSVKVRPKLMDINEAHQKFGHISEKMLKLTAQRDNYCVDWETTTMLCLLTLQSNTAPSKEGNNYESNLCR